ncbi:MAG: RDD family protein [Bacteroidales bacterium]|nr:RDD family protein [Bacteroidales bacterium]
MEVLESENTGQVKYAGFWLRFVAYLIDDIIMSAIGFVISLPFIGTIIFSGIALSDMDKCEEKTFLGIAGIVGIVLLLTITLTAVSWLYFALMESSKQQATLGKMALGLKVTDMEGNKVSFGRATGRYFGKIISGMIMMIGYILAGLTEKKQALHDMIAGCLVIRT